MFEDIGLPQVSAFAICSRFITRPRDLRQRFRFDSLNFTRAMITILSEARRLRLYGSVNGYWKKDDPVLRKLLKSKKVTLVDRFIENTQALHYRDTFNEALATFEYEGESLKLKPVYFQYALFACYLFSLPREKKQGKRPDILRHFQAHISHSNVRFEHELFTIPFSLNTAFLQALRADYGVPDKDRTIVEVGFVPSRWFEGNARVRKSDARRVSVAYTGVNLRNINTGA